MNLTEPPPDPELMVGELFALQWLGSLWAQNALEGSCKRLLFRTLQCLSQGSSD